MAARLFFNCNSNRLAERPSMGFDVLADGKGWKVIWKLVEYWSYKSYLFQCFGFSADRYPLILSLSKNAYSALTKTVRPSTGSGRTVCYLDSLIIRI